jgi:AAA domain-containing protein/DNA primase RepB-like protein
MLTHDEQLNLISRAWGKQSGYCFFPWIGGEADSREARIRSYHEGTAFAWPRDRAKILAHMEAHEGDDLYWCPSLFEYKGRRMELAMDEHALWADLDEVDPREIEDYPPTIAWETSPGRYQGLWLITGGDMQGASWEGGANQRLTYHLGADHGGWDTTQLLRIPGWANYKFEYRQNGKAPRGRLLWGPRRRYRPEDFENLPEVAQAFESSTILDDEVNRVDRHRVWGEVRLKLPHTAREAMGAREADGDRSAQMWWLMRCLADAGLGAIEIVALIRPTVWNKFAGRSDEMRRLSNEAAKAVSKREVKTSAELEEVGEERPKPRRLAALLAEVKPPKWLVQGLWAEGSCGFIAGQPKVYKSWVGLDLALSISTGLPFLDHFSIREPGPVLYIQEEDSAPMVKARFEKVWPSKKAAKIVINADGTGVDLVPPAEAPDDPDIAGYINEGFIVSDPTWQSWLDEVLQGGLDGVPFRMVIMDPLMVIAGEVDENRSVDMTQKIFRPLRQLAQKHQTAIAIVHHLKKGEAGRGVRGGQLMLGSVANHAWSEDSLYLKLSRGGVTVERESKHAASGYFKIMGLRAMGWNPQVVDDKFEGDEEETKPNGRRATGPRNGRIPVALAELGPGYHETKVIAEQAGITTQGATKQLQRMLGAGQVTRKSGRWGLGSNGTNE